MTWRSVTTVLWSELPYELVYLWINHSLDVCLFALVGSWLVSSHRILAASVPLQTSTETSIASEREQQMSLLACQESMDDSTEINSASPATTTFPFPITS